MVDTFMLVLMGLALGLLALRTRPALQKVGAGLASVVGTIAVVGSLGEVVAAPTADVPRAAQLSGVLGAAVSLAVVTTGLLYLRATRTSS